MCRAPGTFLHGGFCHSMGCWSPLCSCLSSAEGQALSAFPTKEAHEGEKQAEAHAWTCVCPLRLWMSDVGSFGAPWCQTGLKSTSSFPKSDRHWQALTHTCLSPGFVCFQGELCTPILPSAAHRAPMSSSALPCTSWSWGLAEWAPRGAHAGGHLNYLCDLFYPLRVARTLQCPPGQPGSGASGLCPTCFLAW